MKKLFQLSAMLIILALGIISCKSSCGCGGYGELKTDNQVEQYA
jgi:hypothetical protein